MDRATTVDILHPFASLEWQECRQLPVEMRDATAMWHEDKLYVGGWTPGSHRDNARLYVYTPSTDVWNTPIDTPVCYFGLTTYHSQLVLVGGTEYVSDTDEDVEVTNKLWTLWSEHSQWQETLSPMNTKRHSVCAVSYNDHLLVAGGMSKGISNNIVEIFNGSDWSFAQPLPVSYYDLKSVVIGHYWFLMGGKPPPEYNEQEQYRAVYYASLDSLLASCQSSETSQPSSLWKRLTDAPHQFSSPVVFGGRLIAVGGENPLTSTVHAYSIQTNSWTRVGDLPFATCSTCSIVLPTGELMVVGGYAISKVLKAIVKVTYDPDSQFTISALSRLEEVGIPVITSLNTKIQILRGVLSLFVPNVTLFTNFNDTKALFDAWLHSDVLSHLPPTWKRLLLIIRLLNLDDLAQRMETYLSGVTDQEEQQSMSESSETDTEETDHEEDDQQLILRDEVIYKLKQNISSLKEERDSAIYRLRERNASLAAENEEDDQQVILRDEVIYKLKQNISLLSQKRNSAIFEQLRKQLLVKDEHIKDLTDEKTPLTCREPKEETIMVTKSQLEFSDTWNLHGVEVCGEMTVVVYSSHYQQITWPGYGLRLNIPKGCLPAGMEQCTINIKASLAGLYEFPENCHLVSAIIWLHCVEVHEFVRPITVEIQHCAKLSKLSFVRAVCSQKQLPYTFRQLSGGNFASHSSYGVIKLNSFSGVGVTQEGSEDREYCSQLFYLRLGHPNCKIHFVVTWNIEAHLTETVSKYEEKGAILGLQQPVEFLSDTISLDIPMEGVNTKGWKITPLMRPVVTKKQVDNFREGKLTPYCQLLAEFENTGKKRKIPTLKHQVNLKGAKYPNDIFVINLPTGDANPHERSQTFGDLAAIAGAGPPPTKKSRLHSDESALLTDPSSSQMLSIANRASLAGPASSGGLETKLVKPDLKDLIKELLTKASDKWENIGILLGIEPGRLDTIKAAENLPQNCLREMLKIWLNGVSPPPSWSAIAEAIDLLGDQKLADHLRTKYHISKPQI